MRKEEYIHIHALLIEVTQYMLENEILSAERLSAYDALDTYPSSIHKPKQNHREAIMALTSAVEQPITETSSVCHGESANE